MEDFRLSGPCEETGVFLGNGSTGVTTFVGGIVMARNVSIRRESIIVSRPCCEMSGKTVEKDEPVIGNDTPWLKTLGALTCSLIDDATEFARPRRRIVCGEP